MGQRVDSDVQGQLLAVVRAYAFSLVAAIAGAESAAKAIFAHDRHKIALVK